VYDAEDKVTLINYGIMFLFDSIMHQLSDKTIEEMNHLGQETSMLGFFDVLERILLGTRVKTAMVQ
jgi:hypothetical protein